MFKRETVVFTKIKH